MEASSIYLKEKIIFKSPKFFYFGQPKGSEKLPQKGEGRKTYVYFLLNFKVLNWQLDWVD